MNLLPEHLIKTFDNLHGLVEANEFERQVLWERYGRVHWEDDGIGCGHEIGRLFAGQPPTEPIAERPIFLSFMFATVSGKRICFWHATSELIDYKMIDEWLKMNLRYRHRGDASNFANMLL